MQFFRLTMPLLQTESVKPRSVLTQIDADRVLSERIGVSKAHFTLLAISGTGRRWGVRGELEKSPPDRKTDETEAVRWQGEIEGAAEELDRILEEQKKRDAEGPHCDACGSPVREEALSLGMPQ